MKKIALTVAAMAAVASLAACSKPAEAPAAAADAAGTLRQVNTGQQVEVCFPAVVDVAAA
jgi:ABC-type glycerol-3-phosphate transport system substrate-binding protein